MEYLHAELKDLQLGLQTLLKNYNSLKKENEQLLRHNNEINKRLSEKEKIIEVSEEKLAVNTISILYGAEEKRLLQSKIDQYIQAIEKCLSMLNS